MTIKVLIRRDQRYLPQEAQSKRYRRIIGASGDLLVSSDKIKDTRAAMVDLDSTLVIDGDLLKILRSYHNEWAYAAWMVRQAKTMATG